jgi:glycosyltransferase involved in cell wall biosynthesis
LGLKFLFVIDHYLPIMGGAEIQTQLLGKRLAQRGHEVAIATAWQPGLVSHEKDAGVNIHRIKGLTLSVPWFFEDPDRSRHPPPFPDPGFVLELRRLIRRYQPDVVYAYGWLAYSAAYAMRNSKIPLILTSMDYGYSCATRLLMYHSRVLCEGPSLRKCWGCAVEYYGVPKALAAIVGLKAWRGLLVRRTQAFHAVSTFVQRMVQRNLRRLDARSPQPADTAVIDVIIPHFLVEDEEGEPDQAYLDQLPNEGFILFVGTLAEYKGLAVLMDAYERLESPPPLVLIGITTLETPETFPPGVTVLRDVPHPTVMAAWERCLFGVAPSLCPDALPNVVLEAMSNGKAVVGTAVGGIPDMIIDGETGFLVPLGDADALADAMMRLVKDPTLRVQFGEAAKERAKLFSAEAVIPRYEELGRRLSSSAPGKCE